MILFDDLDDRFYLHDYIVYAQRFIPKDTIIPIQGIAVKKGSAADKCTAYLDDYKFATLYNYDLEDYEYYIICLGYPALFTQLTQESEHVKIILLNSNLPNLIHNCLKFPHLFLRLFQKRNIHHHLYVLFRSFFAMDYLYD